MTDRPSLRCEQVSADLLAGPTDDVQSRRIATHLATCASCRTLRRVLDRDRSRLGEHLERADWLPVADRVLSALPTSHGAIPSGAQPVAPAAPRPRMLGRLTAGPAGLTGPNAATGTGPAVRRMPRPASPIAASLRAACLIVVGLGLGLALQQLWPGGRDGTTAEATQLAATGQQAGALGGQPGTNDRNGTDASSAYVPAPGDNPPLIVPGTTGGITDSQNRDTWRSVRRTAKDGISPLLYPPVPPGTFDSVVIESMATDAFTVRYAAEDMAVVMTAGPDAGTPTIDGDSSHEAVVRGVPATVTIAQTTTPGRGGLRLDGQPSTALAAGTIVEVTWTETGLLRDATTAESSSALPYRVTAAGLPVDVVMTFVDSLAPFGSGWDELRDHLPAGAAIVTPGTMPDGFGAASLVDRTVSGNVAGDGTSVSYTIAYWRVGDDGTDRIVFSATPAGDATESGELTVLGHPATSSATAANTDKPATRVVTWTSGATRYRIDFIGDGFTETDVRDVLGGLTETVVPDAIGTTATALEGSATVPLDRAA